MRELSAVPLRPRGRLSGPTVAERVDAIRGRIADAARRAGRQPQEVTLVGASKRQPIEAMREAWDAGLRVFGENRVQEAEEKRPHLAGATEWHLIGPLQSNKARRSVELFDLVQSVDRLKIARHLDRSAAELGRTLPVLLEIHLGSEPTKHGFAPGEDLDSALAPLAELEHLEIRGLMAIPPAEDPRRWFAALRELRDALADRGTFGERDGLLSMGMSADFEIAIEEGATHVRVGTALFGPRDA